MSDRTQGYRATSDLERELAEKGQASITGARYAATIVSAGQGYFEAYTDSLPFVYGQPSETLQGALDNLEERVREAEAKWQAS